MFKIRSNIALLIIIAVAVVVIVFHIPAGWVYGDGGVVCLHRELFGIGCPLCGMTRAVWEMVHFNFVKSFGENFNVVPVGLAVMSGMVYYFFPSRVTKRLGIVMLCLMLAGFVVVYGLRIARLY